MINPLTLLTSPLDKGLAVAVAALLLLSVSEGLVIKYEMNSKTQCVSAVTATNAQTKTVTTAIRNVDNASTQAIQSSVSSGIANDLASLHYNQGSSTGSALPAVPGSTINPSPTVDTANPNPSTYTVDQVSAEACLVNYDIAKGWQDWYNQTQLNWDNIENLNGKSTSGSSVGGAGKPTAMENLRVPLTSPVWFGVGVGSEDVGQEQPVWDQGDTVSTGDGSSDPRG